MNRQCTLTMLGIVLLTAAAVTGWLSPNGASAALTTVDVADDQFVAANITVTVGDTVTWDWTGSNQHTVTFDDGSTYSSGIQSQPFTTPAVQFSTAGTFAYYCQVHGAPGGNGMSGTVVVQAAAATNTATATATNTAAATNTPGSATATPEATSTPTGTPASSGTAVASAPRSDVTQPAAAPTSTGGAAASAQLPRTGGGPGGRATPWLPLTLSVAGLVLLASGLAVRRRV